MVAFDYLDTHTYPIIPAVKKSPSDIFVVFCLRSERLKIFSTDVFEGLSWFRKSLVSSSIKNSRGRLCFEGSVQLCVFPKMWLY